jgi:large subunit ribosomal protein L25
MKVAQLNANRRESKGSAKARLERRVGLVPAVMYGKDLNIPVQVFINDLNHLVYTPDTYLVDLGVEGQNYRCVIQDIQYDPLTNEVTHLDFFNVPSDKPIKTELPIDFLGVADGVKKGGRLVKQLRRLKVKGLVDSLPARIEVQVEALGLGQSLKVKQLSYDAFDSLNPPNIPLVTVEVPRSMRGKAAAKK